MQLVVNRKWYTEKTTIGELSIDDLVFCYTLEDKVRPAEVKVLHETAIPAGTYQIVIDMSTRFKRLMPHILDVPMFEGIRIHKGNTNVDTEGCILLGMHKINDDFIGNSGDAFNKFFPLLQDALKKGKVYITINDNKIDK